MKTKNLLFAAILILNSTFYILNCSAQNIGINATGATPNASAALDIDMNQKGLLVPRMSTADRNLIASPVESLLIYNTTTQCFEAWNQTSATWVAFGCIGCQLPGTFANSAASGITATTFGANWTASAGATTYFLDVATNAAFTSFVSGYNNLNVGNVLTSSVTGLTCVTTYYYRVRANNTCGTSANSNAIVATTTSCVSCGVPFTDARDGKPYNTVLIGSQCWMKENLNFGTYAAITTPQVAGTKFCQNLSGVNDASCPFGGLYEWTNMMNGSATCNGTGAPPNDKCPTNVQGLCPAGWHVPSHYEWTTLEKNVGTNPGAFPYDVLTISWLGTDEGGNLKQTGTTNWTTPNTGATNSSGFLALPGGYSDGGSFYLVGNFGYWGAATESGGSAWSRALYYTEARVYRPTNAKSCGFSVRCVKD